MENNLILHNSFPLINNFNHYKSYVYKIPTLSEQEERILLEKFKFNDCLEAAQKLVLSQLKTVLHIANQFRNYGLAEEDLVQEGNIGLMKAVKNYDLKYNVRLYTYSLLWIKSEIQNYIIKNWKIVKIGTTKNLKKLFFNFRQIQKEMIDLGIPKSQLNNVISKKLNVSSKETEEMSSYFSFSDNTIDVDYEKEDGEQNSITQLVDENTPENKVMISHDEKLREKILNNLVERLTNRQQEVIKMRFFNDDKKTHKEIAEILGVSSERVRQIELECMNKMKLILNKEYHINEVF